MPLSFSSLESGPRQFFIVAASMTVFCCLICSLLDTTEKIKMPIQQRQPRLCLLWTTMFRRKGTAAWTWGKGKLEKVMKACPFKCQFSVNKSLRSVADAVVYHGWTEGNPMYPLPRPSQRRWDQRWVYFMLEPPCPGFKNYEMMADYNDFNWTMTYRRDSDIPILYGEFENIHSDIEVLPVVRRNRSLVAGMISSCNQPSRRDQYIVDLNRTIHVDLYGKCGNHAINKKSRRKPSRGYDILAKKYKFWLSFENSIAPDYLTEKFFLPLQHGMVPVYLGHPDNLRYAPPGSYIHIKDFKSPEALAKFLVYLDQNPREYLKYFEWRKQYRVKANIQLNEAWCDLCTKLHTLTAEQQRKSYRSIADWFLRNNTATSVCRQNSSIMQSNRLTEF